MKTRNITLTIAGILILSVLGVYASTVVNDGYISQGNYTVNNTGQFYNGAKTSVRTADVVVCRGTSLLDDLYKSFTCDVVCASTDNDCQQELQSSLGETGCNNKVVTWRAGNYPVITRDQISNTAFLYAGCSNFTLNAYGSVLQINYTESGIIQRGFEIGENLLKNVHINGLEIVGNKNNGSGATYGLRLYACKDCSVKDTKVSNVSGFQYTVESVNLNLVSENVLFDNVYGRGIGIGDVIGGGSLTKNIKIINSKFEQVLDRGKYANAIDLVNLSGFEVSGSIVYGGMLVGSEEGGSNSVNFIGNIVYPPLNLDGTWNTSTTAAFGFHPSVNVSYSSVIGNIVYDNLDGAGDLNSNTIYANTFPLATSKQVENYINIPTFRGSNPSIILNASTPSIKLATTQNTQIWDIAASYEDGTSLSFEDDGTERMRIKSDGYVAVNYRLDIGNTDNSHYLEFNGTCIVAQGSGQTGNCL